jgi:hypothetical protein
MTKAGDDVLDGGQTLSKCRTKVSKVGGVGLLDMFQLANMCMSANRLLLHTRQQTRVSVSTVVIGPTEAVTAELRVRYSLKADSVELSTEFAYP